MTLQLTRQLGVEFERRLHQIHPDFQYAGKLDTDIIYSFLSEYQDKYVKELYLAEGQVEAGSRQASRVSEALKTLIRRKTILPVAKNPDTDDATTIFDIPSDYFFYIRSNSIINKNYKSAKRLITEVYTPNVIEKQSDISNALNTYYNKGIIRNPIVILESTQKGTPGIKVLSDKYTNVIGLDLVYYCQPYAFNVINYDDDNMQAGAVHSYCELPFSCFDDLVTGAIDLYIQNYKFKLVSNQDRRRNQRGDNNAEHKNT